MDEMKFFNPWGDVKLSQNRLPHWQQPGATYYVTWHLGDSIPKEKLDWFYEEKDHWLTKNPKPWAPEIEAEYHRLFSAKIDVWLDAGHGSCLLRKPENAVEVKRSLLFFDEKRSQMLSFVVMPNHVHLLYTSHPDWTLETMVASWKKNSAREINRLEGERGNLWQKDYFDRMIRDQQHFERCVRYIRSNPEKAGLRDGEFLLYESDLVKEI